MELLTYFLEGLIATKYRQQKALSAKLRRIKAIKNQLEIAHQSNDEIAETLLWIELGRVYTSTSDFGLADSSYSQAIDLAHDQQDHQLQLVALTQHGLSYKERMDYPKAYSRYQAALAITLASGDMDSEQEIRELIEQLHNMMRMDDLSREPD